MMKLTEKPKFPQWPASSEEAGLCHPDGTALIGRVTYASGEHQEFTDLEAYLQTIREELPYPDLVPVNRRIHDEAVVAYLTTALDWTPKLVLEREKAFIQKHRRLPDIDDYTSENGLPPYSVFSKLARDYYEEMLTLAFQDFLTGEERPAEQRGGGA